eukprot:PLAT6670.2.p2 GENE.PLAT6670.2~~PLAT6670.2.p2  ORF type:complete len:201 (+),score=61.72 PLAT6670.2:320-922(+)
MRLKVKGVTVWGGHGDDCDQDRFATDDVLIPLAGGDIHAITVPCHTPGHVLYRVPRAGKPDALFTGDTLFIAGAGRFGRGGTGEQMAAAFAHIAELPDDTELFVGHEYTTSNLRFAASVEPDSDAIAERLAWAEESDAAGRPTVPSTVADEKATNPFMRLSQPTVRAFLELGEDVAVGEAMAAMRRAKNAFGLGSGKKKR